MIAGDVFFHYSLAFLGAIYVAAVLHEGSHYVVGWLGRTEPTVLWVGPIPNGVDHGRIKTMDPAWIRLSGLAVLGWCLPATVAMLFLLFDRSPLGVFYAATPLFVVVGMSVSDYVAIRDPELFRTLWIGDAFDGGNAWLQLLLGNSIPTSTDGV
jgi:hypothetical protein